MLAKLRQQRDDDGFTLVELLVVVAILGVLSGIVVFSVAGVSNDSQTTACKTEKTTLAEAEEAYYAKNTTYLPQGTTAAGGDLVAAKYLQGAPSWYKVTVTGSGSTATYAIAKDANVANNSCP